MIDVDKLEFYNKNEIREIIRNKEPYVFVDDGMTEVIIKKQDIADYIVYINRESGSTDLEVIDPQRDYEITISTCGEFLNRCVPEAREEIIERLIKLQNNEEEYRKVKTADESMWEDIENELEDEEEMED